MRMLELAFSRALWLGLSMFAYHALGALLLVTSGLCATEPATALEKSWAQWRGPLANGAAPHANPPVQWSETNHVRWKIALPGKGHSSPIVFGNQVYLLAAAAVGAQRDPVFDTAPGVHDSVPVTHTHEYLVMAIGRQDGKVSWRTSVRQEFPHEGGHVTGSPVSNSPTTDGERIYAFFGSRGLYCLDFNGKIIWQKDIGKMQTLHAHGEGSSPVVYGDKLIVNWDHEGDDFLYAFNKANGAIRWRVSRHEITSWSTPIVAEVDGRAQVIVSATTKIRGYDLENGRLIWECAGLTDNVVASPVYTKGVLIAGNSYYKQAMMGIRLLGATGDLTGTDHVVWSIKRDSPYVPSPLLYRDTLYVVRHNQNVLGLFDPMTGLFKRESLRLGGIRDFIFSSPVAGADRIYVTGRDGVTVVLSAEGNNEVLAVNRLGDSFSASAALIDNEMYLRGERFLYCLSEPGSGVLRL